jgi:hypothetical protein
MKAPRRRDFLKSAAGAGWGMQAAAAPKALPTVELGQYRVSRLIAGGNPMRGFSHSSKKLSQHMLDYFTAPQITKFLLHCEQEGIRTFQSSYSATVRDGLLAAWERGSTVQFICLTSDRQNDLAEVLRLKPIAICHHGGVTDSLFRTGQREKVHDFVKKVHDRGVLAGISTHNPDYLARIEDAGWEHDLYMTCLYNLTRTEEELEAMLRHRVLGEVFLASDPPRMAARIRQCSKPCLAFKILASGRLSETQRDLEEAFRFAYASIKPTDAVIVGMYPVFSDEVAQDAELARKYSKAT